MKGFIGHATVAEVDRRAFTVHGTTRRTLDDGAGLPSGMNLHRVDLLDPAAVAELIGKIKPTHLLMCAWTTNHGEYWTDPLNEKWEVMTTALVRNFFAAGGERAVLVGTCAEYDWRDPLVESHPISEDTALGVPHTPYGRAKRRAGEKLAACATAAGGTYAIARLFYPVGPGEDRRRLLPGLITCLLDGRPADLGPGEHVRDIMDVRDVGAALAELLKSNFVGPVNIGTGKGTHISEVAGWVGQQIGRPELIRLGAIPRRPGEPVMLVPDVSRLTREVGFRPKHNPETAVTEAVKYWRDLERERVAIGKR